MLDQALCDEAEPLRQEEAKKQDLKRILWETLVSYIRQNRDLQTQEIMPSSAKPSSSRAKAGRVLWKDDVYDFFATLHPSEDTARLAAEHMVEVHLLPKFINLNFNETVIHEYEQNNMWTIQTKDTLYDSVVG
jgi:hypothetical protein